MKIKVYKPKPEFVDKRGFITRIIDQNKYKIKSVLYINRKKGSVGANHYHKKDVHFIFVLSGRVKYLEKDIRRPKSKVSEVILKPGDLVISKPYIAHTTEFIEDTVEIVFSTENRNKEKYEKDTIKFKLD